MAPPLVANWKVIPEAPGCVGRDCASSVSKQRLKNMTPATATLTNSLKLRISLSFPVLDNCVPSRRRPQSHLPALSPWDRPRHAEPIATPRSDKVLKLHRF